MGCVVNHTCGSKSVLLWTFSEDCGIKLSVSWFFLRTGNITNGEKEKEISTSKMPTVLLASERLLYPSGNRKSQVGVVAVLSVGQAPALHLSSVCQPTSA